MQAACPSYTSEEDYLVAEESYDWRREWCDGAVYEMPHCPPAHSALIVQVGAAIAGALEKRLTGFASSAKIYIEGAKLWTYADTTFVRGELKTRTVRRGDEVLAEAITNPTVILEVLSQETERYDRDGKFQAYKLIPSLEEYVLASFYETQLEVYRRAADGSWSCATATAGGTVTIQGATLAVDDVYAP